MPEKVLWSVSNLNYAIGKQILFKDARLSIHDKERIGLVGRNGCGKSTFLKIVAGLLPPDSGDIAISNGLSVGYLPQDFELNGALSIEAALREALSHLEELLRVYENSKPGSQAHIEAEHRLNLHDGWQPEKKLSIMMDKLALPNPSRLCAELSGGEKRRVTLARALLSEPDLLLLDEPTNHLDVETITWIENFLAQFSGACLFITHDRYFLDRLSSRIVELDNGQFYSIDGNYADFLEAKAEREYAEDQVEYRRRHFLRSEIEWVRRSPKARLKRNLGRVKRYDEIAAQQGPERTGQVELLIPPPPRLGNKTVALENVSMERGGKKLVQHFSFDFQPGQKIGMVGPNGIGKTTLIKLLTGQLKADSGKVEIAETVRFNYMDQEKLRLDPEKSVYESIGEGLDFVMLGEEKITIWGYLKRFLFEDERIKTLVKELSGGERARLTLAKILKQGGNFIILDEPTNDLDLQTLRVLEESLVSFEGCVLCVSHDRYFLNRICDGILGFEGDGNIVFEVGDFDRYAAAREERLKNALTEPENLPPSSNPKNQPRTVKTKLSYKESRELEHIELEIPRLEARIAELHTLFADPEFYAKNGSNLPGLQTEADTANRTIETLYQRWEELQTKAEQ